MVAGLFLKPSIAVISIKNSGIVYLNFNVFMGICYFKKPILKIVTEKPVVEEKMIEKPVAKKAPAKKKGKPAKK